MHEHNSINVSLGKYTLYKTFFLGTFITIIAYLYRDKSFNFEANIHGCDFKLSK